jgi:hypothetical protein
MFSAYDIANRVNVIRKKACSWMTLLACVILTSFMWTLILNKWREFPRTLCTVRSTWSLSARTRKVCVRLGLCKAAAYKPYSFRSMLNRLCTHIHHLTSDYLWNRDWEAVRSWYLSQSLDSDPSRDQGELGQRSRRDDRRREEHLATCGNP